MAHAELTIDLRQMILAIETAVSFVGMNDVNHGKRVGYIASQLGYQLGFSDEDIQFVFDLGLIHDCGVSTEQMHSNLVNHFDWTDANIHCEIGWNLLKNFAPLAAFATPIYYHHTPWRQLMDTNISRRDGRMANLIFLSDRIDVMAASHYEKDILLAREEISRSINTYGGSYFDMDLVDAFNTVEKSEAFWISLEDRHVSRYVWNMAQIESNSPLTLEQLRQLSLIMSYIVDQKSPFTAEHSVLVASLAAYIGRTFGLSERQCEKIEIAGLLHDLGKLHTPDNILAKPAPLTAVERSIMNQHSYETYEILRHIKGLGEVAEWAAYHHEGLNGVGYPFHPAATQLSTEARIIAVADVFQALVQDRPYRKGMSQEEALGILIGMARYGKLDQKLVDHVHHHVEDCFRIASGQERDERLSYKELFPAKPGQLTS
jgi:putative nucleotidyltransferase with HDIG domain